MNGVALLQQTAGSRDHSYRKNHQPELGTQQRRDESRSLPSLPRKVWIKPEKKKLSEKELEQKRQEMMDNAKWREKERERNIANYKAEDEKEEDESATTLNSQEDISAGGSTDEDANTYTVDE